MASKKKKPRLTLVYGDVDWEGLYLDGLLVAEDHRISLEAGLKAIGIGLENVHMDDEWFDGSSGLPVRLDDVRVSE